MKSKFLGSCSVFLFLLYLVAFSTTSARLLEAKQGADEQLNQQIHKGSVSLPKLQDSDSATDLMGLESCENGDEECLKRRLVSEAHLDYIYTQHHRP